MNDDVRKEKVAIYDYWGLTNDNYGEHEYYSLCLEMVVASNLLANWINGKLMMITELCNRTNEHSGVFVVLDGRTEQLLRCKVWWTFVE